MLILWFEGIWQDLAKYLIRLSISIDGIVYKFIDYVYQIFMLLTNASIFSTEDVKEFVSRVYIIIGVVMLFIITYSLLKMLADPNNNKEVQVTGKFIFNIVFSIILISIMPMVFEFAYKVQNALLTNNTIGKIILGDDTTSGDVSAKPSEVIKNGGARIAFGVYDAFFHINPDIPKLCKCLDKNGRFAGKAEGNCTEILTDSQNGYCETKQAIIDSSDVTYYKVFAGAVFEGQITYYYLVSLAAGIVVLYILVGYCIDTGLRAVKLSFFQLIAPIPILARIIPAGKDIFNKWVKITITTFVEVFIRLAILFFGVYMIEILMNKLSLNSEEVFGAGASNISGGVLFFAQAFLIIGILLFVKQAPKLIGDIFGIDSGNMKMGLGSKLSGMLGAGALGAVAGFATGSLGGAIGAKRNGGSFWAGFANGGVEGFKGKGNQWKKQATNQYQKHTGDYKGKAGIFGSSSWGTRFNQKVAGWNKSSVDLAAEKREERANQYEKLKNENETSSVYNAGLAAAMMDDKTYEKVEKETAKWDKKHEFASPEKREEAHERIRNKHYNKKAMKNVYKAKSSGNENAAAFVENYKKQAKLGKKVTVDTRQAENIAKKKQQEDLTRSLEAAVKNLNIGKDKKENK